MLAVLDTGIPLKNVIYYNHTNELAFNWNDYEEKVTQEQFDKFVNTVDKNITFKNCPFTPARVVKVFGGYMCFESDNDYRVWKNQE